MGIYTGEIKKGIFSVFNNILPVESDALSMHCSANVGKDEDAQFFCTVNPQNQWQYLHPFKYSRESFIVSRRSTFFILKSVANS
ncbi:phosphoenolpyruvate carboxykinase (ATP) [Autumnicola psychrophila]|uniref:phosphoenolpyruvate carboxykinase (ATP) n=1 Tax=Autumnicola psychrophila TaxID=3075592 RepID=UPI0032C21C08